MLNKKISFEDSLSSLEKVIVDLESGSKSLDEMVKLYEDGIKLSCECRSKLEAAENRITSLINSKEGLKETPGI